MKMLKTGKVLTKSIEIMCYAGVTLCAVLAIWALVSPATLVPMYQEGNVTIYGSEFDMTAPEMKNPQALMIVMLLTGVVSSVLMALTFRRANGIIVKAIEGAPFQPCTVKWMKEIGYLSIALPVLGFVGSLIAFLVGGMPTSEVMLNLDGFVMGILVLCLTQVFAHGAQLQQDVDGLL